MKKKKFFNFTYTKYFKKKIIKPKNLRELKIVLGKKFTMVGNLRSYGDSAIGSNNHITLKNFNQIIKFNKKDNLIEVESGIVLEDLLKFSTNKGFILPCMPGCKYVTLGGMIANNISGKLYSNNKFKSHIVSLKILNNKNKIVECSERKNKKLFDITVGGKGISGPILSAKIKLRKIVSNKIYQKSVYFNSYKNFIIELKQNKNFEYIVVWLDFSSNKFTGFFFFGKHVKKNDTINFNFKDYIFPNYLLYFFGLFVRLKYFTLIFNNIFKIKNIFFKNKISNLNDFFFPQNKIKNWNSIFKSQGFYQYMFYVKLSDLYDTVNKLKLNFKKLGLFSNFVVLKFHDPNKVSLSLDLPINNNSSKIIKFINYFTKENNLDVELSKDTVLKNINKKTLTNNLSFNEKNKKYFFKNYNSLLYDRLNKN